MRARWRGERKSETDNGVMLELGWAERRTEVWGNLKKLGRSAVRAIANGQPEGTAAASKLAHKRHGHHFLPSARDAAGQCVEKVRILSPGHSRRRRTQTPATHANSGDSDHRWLAACVPPAATGPSASQQARTRRCRRRCRRTWLGADRLHCVSAHPESVELTNHLKQKSNHDERLSNTLA